MEEIEGSDIKAEKEVVTAVDNDIPNADNKEEGSTCLTSGPVPEKKDLDEVEIKSEDEQLLNLMVLDDDSQNQLPPPDETATENDKKHEQTEFAEKDTTETCNNKENIKVETLNCESDDRETNKQLSYNTKKSVVKGIESDSLILTADDDLEKEMSLSDKDRNEKFDKDDDGNSVVLDSKTPKKVDQVEEDGKSVESKADISLNVNNADKNVTAADHATKNESKSVHTIAPRFLWVSNIVHSMKATELKQFVSKVGKVSTAKIVTDGKKCYGYVVMENAQDASECLKVLNNTTFEGRKIGISISKPSTDNVEKDKELNINVKDKNKSKEGNDADDTKTSIKPKDKVSHRIRDSSKTRSRSIKRNRSRDPLTTKFDSNDRFYRRRKSRSIDVRSTDYLRDKLERDRLRRRILEERRRSRDEVMREMHREEKQRELQFKLERERRKLQLERELFEKERRELYRLDVERRKIERERLEVMQERTKLESELRKSHSTRKSDDFNLSSTIVKPHESGKGFVSRDKPKGLHESSFRKIDSKHDRNSLNDSKTSGILAHRMDHKDDFKMGKENRERSKSSRVDLKEYDRSIVSSTLGNDFDLSSGKKMKLPDFKHGDRKLDHGGRRVGPVDCKYYTGRSHNDNDDKKNENSFRKSEFDNRKSYNLAERKYDYGRDAKRSRTGEFPTRETNIRNQWIPSANYTGPWKAGLTTGIDNSPVRYQDANFSGPYGGAGRMPPVFYNTGPGNQDYQHFDHCPQNNGRKY